MKILFLFIILFSSVLSCGSTKQTIDTFVIEKGFNVCKNNEGLDYIEIEGLFHIYNTIHCNNGATFKYKNSIEK